MKTEPNEPATDKTEHEPEKCYLCGNQSDYELYPCERCDEMFCSSCQAEYNQFSQIDYNCCKKCAEAMSRP